MSQIVNISNYNLKISFEDIKINPLLTNLFPITLLSKLKTQGYLYLSDLQIQLQKKIAIMLFSNIYVITVTVDGTQQLDHSLLPFTDRSDKQPLSEISDEQLIEYFIKYNIIVKNLFATVYKEEYKVAINIPSVFLDLKSESLDELQTDISQYIIDNYRRFISIPAGTIPFQPWYGTRIKEYLHNLSQYQVEEMLQTEIDGITGSLKSYFIEHGILDYEIQADVAMIENIEYGTVEYKIAITINNQNYLIRIT